MRYRPEDPLVLNRVSFSVAPGEKPGVLGRIGNGISLLFVYLLRMTEYQRGEILIEEVVWLGLRMMPVEVVSTAPR